MIFLSAHRKDNNGVGKIPQEVGIPETIDAKPLISYEVEHQIEHAAQQLGEQI